MYENNLTTVLREKGFKVTPQRLAVYDVLANTTEHPSAEMIFRCLQPKYPTMSLATVYKTIDILQEMGLVQVLNAGEDSFRYDANVTSHPHICCERCKRVDDLHDIDTDQFIEQVAGKTDYRLTGKQFYFYGVCPKCAAKMQ